MAQTAAERVDELRAEIRRLDHLYYVEAATPAVTDIVYDRLLEELTHLEQQNPELLTTDSPTQRVGDAPVEHLVQVPHQVPMLSIDNTYSREELHAYFERTEKLLDDESIEWVMEYKIDGGRCVGPLRARNDDTRTYAGQRKCRRRYHAQHSYCA